tara:strand:+ start:233 stop:1303 length:1071 start_codon:yes stop_codon:yes gene_type:complete
MVEPFVYTSQPSRIVFGAGTLAQLADEVTALGGERVLFCCTPGRKSEVEEIAAGFQDRLAGICDIAKLYVPVEIVAEGVEIARAAKADCLVSYGGGTAVGLAKGIALELDIPIVAVITTYSGSETTSMQGMLDGGAKKMFKSPRMLPKTVIYDPDLTAGVPLNVLVPSGVNAMAHAVEAFYAEGANPVSSIIAEEGLRAMATALPRLADDPSNMEARADGLYGAWLCAVPLVTTGVALHHKAAHVVGGGWDLPHADTHTIILPHATAYNRDAAPEAMQRIARALGADDDAPGAIFDLLKRSGAPTALRDLGMPEEGIAKAADLIASAPYFNPSPVERAPVLAMLEDAWHGRRPGAG